MLIIFRDLEPKKGIPYCRDHLRRLWKAGKFPKPIDVGPGRLAWVEAEIDAYIEAMVAKRDAEASRREGTTGPETKPSELAKPVPAIAERSTAPAMGHNGRPPLDRLRKNAQQPRAANASRKEPPAGLSG